MRVAIFTTVIAVPLGWSSLSKLSSLTALEAYRHLLAKHYLVGLEPSKPALPLGEPREPSLGIQRVGLDH